MWADAYIWGGGLQQSQDLVNTFLLNEPEHTLSLPSL